MALREHQGVVRVPSVVAIVVGLALLGHALPVERLAHAAAALVERLGARGPVAFGALYVVGALLLIPGSPLTLVAVALFGPLTALILVSVGSTVGAALAFLLARTLARGPVERLARRYPRFGAIDRAVAEDGWRVVVLLRLSPIVPYTVINYLFGLTGVRFWPYVLASWLGMLPGTAAYVYLAYLGVVGLGDRERGPLEWALLGVGVAVTVAVTWLLARRARRALAEAPPEPAADDGDAGPRPPRSVAVTTALAVVALLVLGAGVAAALGLIEALLRWTPSVGEP